MDTARALSIVKHFRFQQEILMTKINFTAESKIVAAADAKVKIKEVCREGTAKFERVAAVVSSKRVELALAKGARNSTVRFCVERGLIKVAA